MLSTRISQLVQYPILLDVILFFKGIFLKDSLPKYIESGDATCSLNFLKYQDSIIIRPDTRCSRGPGMGCGCN